MDDYNLIKQTLLEALSYTSIQDARRWWSTVREPENSYNGLYQRNSTLNQRRLEHLGDSKKDITNFITLSKFLDRLPHQCYNNVVSRQPTSGREAARLATEYQQSQATEYQQSQAKFNTRRNAFSSYHQGNTEFLRYATGQHFDNGHHNNSGDHVPISAGAHSQGVQGGGGNVSNSSDNRVSSAVSASNTPSGSFFKPMICHGCGQPGHIRPNCPNRVKRVSSPTLGCCDTSNRKKALVHGLVNGIDCHKLLELIVVASSHV